MKKEESPIVDPELLHVLRMQYMLAIVILAVSPVFVTYGWDESNGPGSPFLLVQFPWYPVIAGTMTISTREAVMMVAFPVGAAICILDAIWAGIHLDLIKKRKIKKASVMKFTIVHLLGNGVALVLGMVSNYFGCSVAGALIFVFSAFGYMLARQKEKGKA